MLNKPLLCDVHLFLFSFEVFAFKYSRKKLEDIKRCIIFYTFRKYVSFTNVCFFISVKSLIIIYTQFTVLKEDINIKNSVYQYPKLINFLRKDKN